MSSPNHSFPRLLPVRQAFPDRRLPNVEAETRRQMQKLISGIRPGSRIAVGAGSRGIRDILPVIRGVVGSLREAGAEPFLFPAMGSHGSATAEGQADVLRHFGLTEEAVGCPIRSSLEVVSLGMTSDGAEALMDRQAFESDGVILVNRIKWHTSFDGPLESGLFKMMAIGLGKFAGAQRYHTLAYRLGMSHVIRTVGHMVLNSGKMLGGVAILEDAYHQTAQVEALPAAEMESREEDLLRTVKSWMPRIPVSELHVLILDEIGKTISGTGMDTKVVNRSIRGEYNPWPSLPLVHRIFVRDLSPDSYGNGNGIGLADVTHDRVLSRIQWPTTWINSITASSLAGSRLPIHFSSDRECLERMAATVGLFDPAELRIGWLRNTLELGEMWLSETLREEIDANPALSILGPARDWEFDDRGDLRSWQTSVSAH